MPMWDPWRGCHRYSEGCKYCYIHKGDMKRGRNTDEIIRTDRFDAPVARLKNGEYKMKSGGLVYLCFSSDFLLEDADPWRGECWDMIRSRPDLHFLFLTKRITRFMDCIPDDWGEGWDNVTVGCTVENQSRADQRLPGFLKMPIKNRNIILQPMLEEIDLSQYLDGVGLVVLGGESDRNARPLNYDWVLRVREECIRHRVSFQFRQCGTHFIKDGKEYTIPVRQQSAQARKARLGFEEGETDGADN